MPTNKKENNIIYRIPPITVKQLKEVLNKCNETSEIYIGMWIYNVKYETRLLKVEEGLRKNKHGVKEVILTGF